MNKEEQKQLIVDIMNEDTKDGLYKQQTAVEWLAEKYNYITWMRNRDEISAGTADEWRAKYLEQAKEMQKEQHENTWYAGDEDGAIHEFEYYWEETYGGNK